MLITQLLATCLSDIRWLAYTWAWVSPFDASTKCAAWVLRPPPTLSPSPSALKGLQIDVPQRLTPPIIFSVNHFFFLFCQTNNMDTGLFFSFCECRVRVWTAFWQPFKVPEKGLDVVLSRDLFRLFFYSGNSPKIHWMCGHKLWTTIVLSRLDVDEDGWCNSLYKYGTKISPGDRTADPLSRVLHHKESRSLNLTIHIRCTGPHISGTLKWLDQQNGMGLRRQTYGQDVMSLFMSNDIRVWVF